MVLFTNPETQRSNITLATSPRVSDKQYFKHSLGFLKILKRKEEGGYEPVCVMKINVYRGFAVVQCTYKFIWNVVVTDFDTKRVPKYVSNYFSALLYFVTKEYEPLKWRYWLIYDIEMLNLRTVSSRYTYTGQVHKHLYFLIVSKILLAKLAFSRRLLIFNIE